MATVADLCPTCGWTHADTTHVVGSRFTPGPKRYAANHPNATVRATRAEAEADWCARKQEVGA